MPRYIITVECVKEYDANFIYDELEILLSEFLNDTLLSMETIEDVSTDVLE